MTRPLRTLLSLAVFTAACTEAPAPDPASQPGEPGGAGEITQAVATTSFTATYSGQGNGSTSCNST
ncbi:MAG TPA: hypothetical protein VFK02_29540, partial [Kofleriaceae bacterium]|nr:hypothetical protein [Kofleriaceae bacterium]